MRDIWQWVEQHIAAMGPEQADLGDMVRGLAQSTLAGEHPRVDAAGPGVRARLAKMEQPWLEVFAGHWAMQSKIALRRDVRHGVLQDAITLLERAHREDAIECPQTVCVSQDVCIAYGVMDGPGWAAERMQVAEETLGRIDSSWPCFRCISEEYALARGDSGDLEGALAFVRRQTASAVDAGHEIDLNRTACALMLDLGLAEDALAAAAAFDAEFGGANAVVEKALLMARALLALGRSSEALEALPPLDELLKNPTLFDSYVRFVLSAMRLEALEWSDEHGATISRMVRTLARHESRRETVDLGLLVAGHLMQLGDYASAGTFLDLAASAVPHLRAPLGADEALSSLQRAWAEGRPESYGTDRESAEKELFEAQEAGDLSFSRLDYTLERYPDWVALAIAMANRWLDRGWPDRAHQALASCREHNPEDSRLIGRILDALVARGAWVELETELAALDQYDVPPDLEVERRFHLARLRWEQARRGEAIDITSSILDDFPEHKTANVLRRLVLWTTIAGRLDEAVRWHDEVVGEDWSNANDQWFRMETATRLADWDRVRDSAAVLEIQLESESGPIDEHWDWVRLQGASASIDVWAERRGPCTARVTTITGPEAPELHGAVYAFDPFPVSDGPPVVFKVNEQLSPPADRNVPLDGARPAEQDVNSLIEWLHGRGWGGYVGNSDDYVIRNSDTGETLAGIHVRIAVPLAASVQQLEELAERFHQLSKTVEGPLVWTTLCELLGDDVALERARSVAVTWGL